MSKNSNAEQKTTDSMTGNKAGLSVGKKKFNVNFIVNTNIFLYN